MMKTHNRFAKVKEEYTMLGAIIGDMSGSRFEWDNIKTKDFELLNEECFPTDDSIMTLAIAKTILECNGDYAGIEETVIKNMQTLGRLYPLAGYGARFYDWLFEDNPIKIYAIWCIIVDYIRYIKPVKIWFRTSR